MNDLDKFRRMTVGATLFNARKELQSLQPIPPVYYQKYWKERVKTLESIINKFIKIPEKKL